MSQTRVLLISKDGQFKFCSISVTELVLWYRLVTLSSCSSLNFFNLINLGSSMGIPYSRGILQFWSNKCFIGMRDFTAEDLIFNSFSRSPKIDFLC